MQTIMVIIFWELLMFDQIFLTPQVKRSVIISNKHGLYELLYTSVTGVAQQIQTQDPLKLVYTRKIPKPHKTIAQRSVPHPNKGFVNTSKKLLKNRNWTFPIASYFTWRLEFPSVIFCPWLHLHTRVYLCLIHLTNFSLSFYFYSNPPFY